MCREDTSWGQAARPGGSARRFPAMSWVDELATAHRDRILRLVPAADVRLSGGALVDGVNSVDVDLVALVDDVAAAAQLLHDEYPALYPERKAAFFERVVALLPPADEP
jgi:hypothetical protein